MDMSSFADSLKRKEKKRDEAYAYVTLFVQEKGEEDRGEESAAGQEDRGRGVRCKEWQQMHNPLVESIERASCVCVWCARRAGPRPRHLSCCMYQCVYRELYAPGNENGCKTSNNSRCIMTIVASSD